MQLTYMGMVLIPVGLFTFIFKYEWLIYLMVFFSAFTGASILNISDISVQPSYYFFILFLLRYFFKIIKKGEIIKPNKFLTLFMVISLMSLVMSYLLEGKNVIVLNPNDEYDSVKFSIQNITQYMYLLFGFLVYWTSKDYIIRFLKYRYEKLVKVFLWSTTIICILGIYQQMAYILGLPFDDFFRQGVHGNIQTFGSFIRVYSVFIEPSMYSIFLILSLVISICIPNNIWRYKNVLIFLIIINGIMSTSSTFIVGIILIMVIFFIGNIKIKYSKDDIKLSLYFILLLTIIMLSVLIISKFNSDIIDNIINGLVDKINGKGDSASSRSIAFMHHMKIALKYPILGTGFGSVRSYDLISTWMSSIGVIGVFVFILFLINIVVNLKDIILDRSMYKGYSLGIFIIFILMFISVPEPYGVFIWISIAILEVIYYKTRYIDYL